jgi:hypothetical protein
MNEIFFTSLPGQLVTPKNVNILTTHLDRPHIGTKAYNSPKSDEEEVVICQIGDSSTAKLEIRHDRFVVGIGFQAGLVSLRCTMSALVWGLHFIMSS